MGDFDRQIDELVENMRSVTSLISQNEVLMEQNNKLIKEIKGLKEDISKLSNKVLSLENEMATANKLKEKELADKPHNDYLKQKTAEAQAEAIQKQARQTAELNNKVEEMNSQMDNLIMNGIGQGQPVPPEVADSIRQPNETKQPEEQKQQETTLPPLRINLNKGR